MLVWSVREPKSMPAQEHTDDLSKLLACLLTLDTSGSSQHPRVAN